MAPKKKKGNKLIKLSEEEKLRYLQQRAALEEEQKRRKEELISNFMKNKLQHEESFTKLNNAKINEQWRQILRNIKCKELYDIAETLQISFEAALRAKNKIISNLVLNLENSESQRGTSVKNHIEQINTILIIGKERLLKLRNDYLQRKNSKLENWKKEKSNLEQNWYSKMIYLNNIFNKTEIENFKDINFIYIERQEIHNEILRECTANRLKMLHSNSVKLEEYWQDFEKLSENFKKSANELFPSYEKLKETDKVLTLEIKNLKNGIHNNQILINQIKSNLNEKEDNYKVRIHKLEKEINDNKTMLRETLENIKKENTSSKSRLIQLTIISNTVIQKYEKIFDKCNNITQTIEKCDKYITEQEKYYNDFNENNKEEKYLLKLNEFWKKYNKVEMDVRSLIIFRNQAAIENNHLKDLIKSYLSRKSENLENNRTLL